LTSEWADFAGFDWAKPKEIPERKTHYFLSSTQLVAGMALFLAVFAAIWFYKNQLGETGSLTRKERYKNDINAGSNKATVTLADGNLLFLGDTSKRNGIPGVELSEGQITYLSEKEQQSAGFNTVRTPAGGEYRVVLPDGSSAKLNAASSIHFPVF